MKLSKFDQQVLERLQAIENLQAKMAISLEEHMRRTSLLEESIKLIRDDIKPVQKHVAQLEGALKLVGAVCVLSGAAFSLFRLITGII